MPFVVFFFACKIAPACETPLVPRGRALGMRGRVEFVCLREEGAGESPRAATSEKTWRHKIVHLRSLVRGIIKNAGDQRLTRRRWRGVRRPRCKPNPRNIQENDTSGGSISSSRKRVRQAKPNSLAKPNLPAPLISHNIVTTPPPPPPSSSPPPYLLRGTIVNRTKYCE